MDGSTVTDPNMEMSIRLLRDNRDEMAMWLALEVLQLDPVAQEDRELQECLIACQDRLQDKLRERAAPTTPAARAQTQRAKEDQ